MKLELFKNKNYIIITLIVFLIIIIFFLFKSKFESFGNEIDFVEKGTWSTVKCNYKLANVLEDLLKKHSKENNKNPELIFPCTYDSIETEYKNMPTSKDSKYMLIDNIDIISAKNYLYKTIRDYYKTKESDPQKLHQILLSLMPETFILNEEEDMKRLQQDMTNDILIAKNNVQRQEGLLVTRDKNKIKQLYEKEKAEDSNYPYVLAQKLLQDPFLVNGRKINLRVYVLLKCEGDKFNVYMYDDGFMYYTPKHFQKNTEDRDVNITTGYIDRQVYVENPLTHTDFKKYLDENDDEIRRKLTRVDFKIENSKDVIFNNIKNLLNRIFVAYEGKIGQGKKLYNNTKIQLFGADVAIGENLDAKIMEINKGPDLGAKDERDKQLKTDLVKNILNMTGIISVPTEKKFITIL